LRNNFWMGNYQRTIHEGSALKIKEDALVLEAKSFVLRAMIAKGDTGAVLEDYKGDQPAALEAVKLLARMKAFPEKKDTVLLEATQWMDDASFSTNVTLQTVAATIFFGAGDYKSALKALQHKRNMEQTAMTCQVYLKMNRLDLAQKAHDELTKIDDDHSLTQLCRALVWLALGGAKYQEAAYIFEELMQKYGSTSVLLNGQALTQMHLGRFEAAEQTLVDALGKDDSDPATLVNAIVCAQCLHRDDDIIQRHIRTIRKVAPSHPWVVEYDAQEKAFDTAVDGATWK